MHLKILRRLGAREDAQILKGGAFFASEAAKSVTGKA
jgi:hypothetical protein